MKIKLFSYPYVPENSQTLNEIFDNSCGPTSDRGFHITIPSKKVWSSYKMNRFSYESLQASIHTYTHNLSLQSFSQDY